MNSLNVYNFKFVIQKAVEKKNYILCFYKVQILSINESFCIDTVTILTEIKYEQLH